MNCLCDSLSLRHPAPCTAGVAGHPKPMVQHDLPKLTLGGSVLPADFFAQSNVSIASVASHLQGSKVYLNPLQTGPCILLSPFRRAPASLQQATASTVWRHHRRSIETGESSSPPGLESQKRYEIACEHLSKKTNNSGRCQKFPGTALIFFAFRPCFSMAKLQTENSVLQEFS